MADELSSDDGPPSARKLILAVVVAFVLLVGMYIALVGEWDSQDLVTGAGAAGAALVAGGFVSQWGRALPAFRRRDLAEVARIVPRTVVETVQVFAAAARQVRGHGEPSRTLTVETDSGAPGWRGARRAGVLGALLSVTPNSYVIDLDPQSGSATIHELVPSDPGTGSS